MHDYWRRLTAKPSEQSGLRSLGRSDSSSSRTTDRQRRLWRLGMDDRYGHSGRRESDRSSAKTFARNGLFPRHSVDNAGRQGDGGTCPEQGKSVSGPREITTVSITNKRERTMKKRFVFTIVATLFLSTFVSAQFRIKIPKIEIPKVDNSTTQGPTNTQSNRPPRR